jgi:septin 7
LAKEVGLGSLSNHFLQRSRREGADFNLLVIGPAGCGKSTLLSNIYCQEVLPSDRRRYARVPNTIEFIEHESTIKEAGVDLRLKVTEVLGYAELSFGGASAQKENINKIVKSVEEKHRQFFDSENYAQRSNAKQTDQLKDKLYHAAIVFIQPQRNLAISANDITLLQALQSRVNIIPVIAKADTFVGEELFRIKFNLKKAFNDSKILLFPNITDVSDDDWVIKEAVDVRSHCPFLTIAAKPEKATIGARSRQYPWGIVSIDAPVTRSRTASIGSNHSLSITSAARLIEQSECFGNDLLPMQKMLIRSHFEFLKRHTVEKLYENFRTEIVCHVQMAPEAPMRLIKSHDCLNEVIATPDIPATNIIGTIEQDDGDDETFPVTPLHPIIEEEEPSSIAISLVKSFSASLDNMSNKKKSKKSSLKHLKNKSAQKLDEIHDDLVSPLPGIQ